MDLTWHQGDGPTPHRIPSDATRLLSDTEQQLSAKNAHPWIFTERADEAPLPDLI